MGEQQRASAWPTQGGEPVELPSRFPPSQASFRPRGSWRHRRETGEIKRGRREGPSRRSGRGTEGDCPAHSGLESLLSSQANPLPSKAPSRSQVLGGIGRRPRGEQDRQVGGVLWEEWERSRRQLPHSPGPGEPAELPGWSPALQGSSFPQAALVLRA